MGETNNNLCNARKEIRNGALQQLFQCYPASISKCDIEHTYFENKNDERQVMLQNHEHSTKKSSTASVWRTPMPVQWIVFDFKPEWAAAVMKNEGPNAWCSPQIASALQVYDVLPTAQCHRRTPCGYHCMKQTRRRSFSDSLNTKTSHGGVCLFYRTRYAVRCLKLPYFISMEKLAFQVQSSSANFVLVVAYGPGSKGIHRSSSINLRTLVLLYFIDPTVNW